MTLENEKDELVIVHEFNAPKKLVFNAFAKEDALAEWWGPVECKNTVLKLDFRPGGHFHFKMEKDGVVNYGIFKFITIQPYEVLEFTNSFADADGNIIKAPFDMVFPLVVSYRLVFTERNKKTTITMRAIPLSKNFEETAGFKSITGDMRRGFGATFDKLSRYLEQGV